MNAMHATGTTAMRNRAAEVFKAMGHPVRLLLLEALAHEECCVCHLTCLCGKRQPYVSQQLMSLRQAGLVLDRRDGIIVYYRLVGPEVAELMDGARKLLRAGDLQCPSARLPYSPLRGCPCPKCTALSGKL